MRRLSHPRPELPVGGFQLQGQDINDLEEVVGSRGSGNNSRAFRWTEGEGVLDLNTLMDPSGAGWILRDASGLNNRGMIVGWGIRNGQSRVFLMTPVPEPATLAALGFGAALLLRRRRK